MDILSIWLIWWYGGYMDDDAPKIGLSIMEFGSYGIEPQLIKLDFIIYLLENLESTLRSWAILQMVLKYT